VGQKLFESQCALCHGQTGGGGRGPNLHRLKLNQAPDESALRKVISEGIAPEMPAFWQMSDREVASVAAYVRTLGSAPSEPVPGDASRGERLYVSKGCGGCHMIAGDGSGYGPELTDVGVKRSLAFLRESIVAPEASVPEGFLLVELVTSSGETIRGIRLNEDTFSIQVKDSSNVIHSFRKADLSELRKLRGKSHAVL
jgi:cytochrome c oxidase cbb3-type subunit 3